MSNPKGRSRLYWVGVVIGLLVWIASVVACAHLLRLVS